MKPFLSHVGKYPVVLDMADKPHHDARVDLQAPRAGILHTTEGGWVVANRSLDNTPLPLIL
jgi:hypothetical protein